MHTLQTLQIFGLDPASEAARRAIALIAEHGRWEHAGQRYFDGEVEPCINGRTIETGAYFGVDVSAIVDRILGERLADGGWNCEAENGSVRSSFDTTIDVLDGLLEFERATGGSAAVRRPAAAGRSTCSSAACSVARARARSSIRRVSTSRSRTTGATMRCAHSTTSAARALDPNPRMAEAVEACGPSGGLTAGGWSTASIRVASTSTSRRASEGRAAGTPSAHSGCSNGGKARLRARRHKQLQRRKRASRRAANPVVPESFSSGDEAMGSDGVTTSDVEISTTCAVRVP